MTPLPRDTRDTWLLLGLIGWTVMPHLWRQPLWLAVLCVGVLLWRGWLAARQAPLPRRWVLLALLLLLGVLTWQSQRTLVSRDAGVLLLVSLMALKTLEMRAQRDAMLLFFLGFFVVLTNFLYSQSLALAAAMALAVWGWLTVLTLAHMPAGRPTLASAAGLALRATAWGTPVMLALFLLFPRLAPLWSVPGDGAVTGLSDSMQPGDVAELALDDSVALRLRFEGRPPPAASLYLRGPVLVRQDGRRWRTAPGLGESSRSSTVSTEGPGLGYEITIEPGRTRSLPLLELTPNAPAGLPPELSNELRQEPGLQWSLNVPTSARLRLQARAWPQGRLSGDLGRGERRVLLSLAPGAHPRMRAWAQSLLDTSPSLQQAGPLAWAQTVLRHVREQPFRYTLSPGPYEGDVVDEFWFDRRAGFCEHYASAFVVAMRALGVPARIVTGYQGSDPQPVDGYLVVRQSNAHAWAEIWVEGQGWLRVDPTAAVAPERIERGRALPAPTGLVAGTLDTVSPGLSLVLRQWAEALDNRWNQWVLGYGRQEQYRLLEDLGFETPDMATLGRALAVLMALAATAGAVWVWLDRRRRTPWQRLQAWLIQELDRLDVVADDTMSPAAMARQLQQRHGASAAPLVAQLDALQAWRYAPAVAGTPQPRASWRDWQRRLRQARRAVALPDASSR
ncbi:transglutaminase family protein [Ideonella alba]|nr:DUF3488 and transglutaminase-like domain-containing protein [Ideonella alba]